MIHRSGLACLATLALILPGTASAQRGQQWAFRNGEWATLAFEVPQTSDQSFYLGCDKANRKVSLSVRMPLKGAEPGTRVTMSFDAPGAKTTLAGKTETDELYPFVFPSAENVAPGPLLALLAGPGEIVVQARRVSMKLPDDGRAKMVEAFRANCPVK